MSLCVKECSIEKRMVQRLAVSLPMRPEPQEQRLAAGRRLTLLCVLHRLSPMARYKQGITAAFHRST